MTELKKRFIRLRNAKIVVAWARRGMSSAQIGEKYHLTERRVNQILYDNHDFLKLNQTKEKQRRINILNRLIESKKENSNRDILELLEAQRKEVEGDGSVSSHETKIIIVRASEPSVHLNGNGHTNGRAEDHSQTVSRSLSV